MPNYRTNISLYLLCLAIPLASAMPAAKYYNLTNSTAGAITEASRAHKSSLHAPHKIEVHSSTHHGEHDDVVEITHHYSLKKDAEHDAATNETHLVSGGHPSVVNSSIKKGGGGANTRGSGGSYTDSGSDTDSSGISYDEDDSATYIPLGGGNSIYYPFGDIFDPWWSSASALDGSVAMARAMALSVATVLTIYWIL
ncbi:hypothetical protein F4782DRAFT_499724 [Xylaria castorea]|nr:hypothetical protein F4782DRAFT_499724 [Xylaria castorea]